MEINGSFIGSLLNSLRNRILFGFHVVRARLSGGNHVCVNYLCEALDRETSKPYFVHVVLSAPGYRQSLLMVKKHVHLEGAVLRGTPEIIWADSWLHVPPGMSQTFEGRVYFDG